MSRFPSRAAGALAIAIAALGLLAAGCGNGGGHAAATATASTAVPGSLAPCKLDRAQRRTVARALADIRRLRRIQAPMQTYSQHGAPTQDAMTGKFEMDLGATNLPPNVYVHLLHLARTAVDLCGACSQALEAAEPFLGNRGAGRCG